MTWPGCLGRTEWRSERLGPYVLPLVWGLCVLLVVHALVPLRFLPMVDMPEHAAHLYTILHHDDPLFSAEYQLSWRTQFWLYYALALPLGSLLGAVTATKVLAILAALAVPLVMDVLLRKAGADRWWALLGFALGLGFSFQWGFLPYVVTLPVALLLIAAAYSHAHNPSVGGGVVLAFTGCLVALGHMFALAFSMGISVLVLATHGSGSLRNRTVRAWPLIFPVAVAGVVVGVTRDDLRGGLEYGTRPLVRLQNLPSQLVSVLRDDAGTAISWMMIGIILIATVYAWRGGQTARRFLPAGVVTAAYFILPAGGLGTAFAFERLPLFMVVMALTPLSATFYWQRRGLVRLIVTLTVTCWLAILGVRCRAFDMEARQFEPLMERMGPKGRALSLVFLNTGSVFASPVFAHFPYYYQATQGGIVDPPCPLHRAYLTKCRNDLDNSRWSGLDWFPQRFDFAAHAKGDFIVSRSSMDMGPWLFREANRPVTLVLHNGPWWLYQVAPEREPGSESGVQ